MFLKPTSGFLFNSYPRQLYQPRHYYQPRQYNPIHYYQPKYYHQPEQYYQPQYYHQPQQYQSQHNYQSDKTQQEPVKLEENHIQSKKTVESNQHERNQHERNQHERNQHYLNLYEKEMDLAKNEMNEQDNVIDDDDIINVSDRNFYDKYSFKTNWANSWKESNIRPTGWFEHS